MLSTFHFLQKIFSSAVFQFGDEGLDVGGTVASRDEQRIVGIDDDEAIHAEDGDGPFVSAIDEIAGTFEFDGFS